MAEMICSSIGTSPFCQKPAATPLRVTCYGSSSSKTPAIYLQEARHLGYILAKRGHTCVNGAGSFGCMAALNEGAAEGNGHIVGVIHEMWMVDKQDWASSSSMTTIPLRVGKQRAHAVFSQQNDNSTNTPGSSGTREMLIAGGDDLQERKKLLVDKADALVVLPGGPGTWDELWEMACARKLGMANSVPICVINVDGFYDPFFAMLERAYKDELLDQKPEEIMKFVQTAQEAVEWVEKIQDDDEFANTIPTLQKRSTALKVSLNGKPPTVSRFCSGTTWTRSISNDSSMDSPTHSSSFSDDGEHLSDSSMEQ